MQKKQNKNKQTKRKKKIEALFSEIDITHPHVLLVPFHTEAFIRQSACLSIKEILDQIKL